MRDLKALAPPLERAMRATRTRILDAFRTPPARERFKDDGSAVTDLDVALERDLAAVLLGLEPSFGLRGEESGEIRAGQPTWYLDALDGTANFARRIAVFGSQVALVDGDEVLFAAVYDPFSDAFTWAARGAGTWHEGVRVSMPERPLREAIVCVDIARHGPLSDRSGLLGAVRRGCYKVRALGTIAVHLRHVAVGGADGYLGGRRKQSAMHDVAPGVLLVREAGGHVSDGAGGDPLLDRRMLVVGGPELHDWLCAQLAQHP